MAEDDAPASWRRRHDARPAPIELAVLRASATGRSTAEVADVLGVDPEAVRGHIAGAIAALGVRSKLEAIVLALRTGWIEIEGA